MDNFPGVEILTQATEQWHSRKKVIIHAILTHIFLNLTAYNPITYPNGSQPFSPAHMMDGTWDPLPWADAVSCRIPRHSLELHAFLSGSWKRIRIQVRAGFFPLNIKITFSLLKHVLKSK